MQGKYTHKKLINEYKILSETLERRDNLKDLGVGKRLILDKYITAMAWPVVKQNKYEWRVLVNTVMDFRESQKASD